MKFGNVEFNDELMEALRDGDLVIFAGAGVSIPKPSNLPSFGVLLQRIKQRFQVCKRDGESVDQFLGRIEAQHDIRPFVAEQLASDEPNQIHRDLLDIRPREADSKLVTTNFDRLFEATESGLELRASGKVYTAPAPPPGGRFTGIVNLHGVVDCPDDMVLTDSDIGRAYLDERWALDFLQGLFRAHRVLFVGYSHQDPIIRYLARAIPTGNEPRRRFILTDQRTTNGQSWSSLGIEPILYQLDSNGSHGEAAEAIALLAEYQRRAPAKWQQLIQVTVGQPMPPADTALQNIADRAIQDVELTAFFTANAEDLSWIDWCSDRGYLAGIFDDEGPVENPLLLPWLARLLVAHDPEDSLRVIAEHGRRVHPQLWRDIIRELSTGGQPKSAADVSRWTWHLLSTSPADQDPRKPDGLHQLAHLGMTSGLDREAAAIFGELYRPAITMPPRPRHGASAQLTTVGEPSVLADIWDTLKAHIHVVAFPVLEPAVHQIEYRQLILLGRGEGVSFGDTDSSGRPAIEDSTDNRREAGIDTIVDAARDCLEWLSQNEPAILDGWLERLVGSPAVLARRLAVHTVRVRADWDAAKKVEWLLGKDLLSYDEISFETEKLIEQEYNSLNHDDQKRLTEAISEVTLRGEGS